MYEDSCMRTKVEVFEYKSKMEAMVTESVETRVVVILPGLSGDYCRSGFRLQLFTTLLEL